MLVSQYRGVFHKHIQQYPSSPSNRFKDLHKIRTKNLANGDQLRVIYPKYLRRIWKNLAAEVRSETEDPAANSKIQQHYGRFFRWEESEVNTEILQNDATFTLQLGRSGVGELHMPSRITSNCKTSVEAQRKLWRLLVSNIPPHKPITFVVSMYEVRHKKNETVPVTLSV